MASDDIYISKKRCKDDFLPKVEIALNNVGGDGYNVSAGKQNLLDNLVFKVIKSDYKGFFPEDTYEERNKLDTAFRVGGDRTGSDSNEEQVSGSTEGLAHNTIATLSVNVSASRNKKSSKKRVISSQAIPPGRRTRQETGYEVYICKYEVSLNVNCDVSLSNWSWWNSWRIWRWWSYSNNSAKSKNSEGVNNSEVEVNGYVKTVSAHYVLSKINGWDESKSTVIIEMEHEANCERYVVY